MSGIGAAPIPDSKKMDCMVTDVAIYTWRQKKIMDRMGPNACSKIKKMFLMAEGVFPTLFQWF